MKPIVNGNVVSEDQNANWAVALRASGLNTVRQLIDRDIDFSAGTIDCFADAYTVLNGRESTVTTPTTTADAVFDTNKYKPTVSDLTTSGTTHDPDSFTNVSNAFDSDLSTYASKNFPWNYAATPFTVSLGKTFTAQTIGQIRYKVYFANGPNAPNYINGSLVVQTYNGSVWSTVSTLATFSSLGGGNYEGLVSVGSSIQGIRVGFTATSINGSPTADLQVYALHGGGVTASTIVHTIPAGRISPTMSSACLVPFIANWETGADIQYKITNGGSDTGWLTCGITTPISTFTAFAAEPTTLQIKLIPKVSSPTGGYPSIRGFTLYAE